MKKAGPIDRLRKICLALPDAMEKIAWGAPTFRVRERMFVMFADDHHGDGRIAMWCKATSEMQVMLVDANPARYFVPAYVGKQGWVGMRLDQNPNWKEVEAIVGEAYELAIPPQKATRKKKRAR